MRTTRVFIIHPQRLVCVALRDLMEKFGDLMVVGVSCDFAGAQAAEKTRNKPVRFFPAALCPPAKNAYICLQLQRLIRNCLCPTPPTK